MNYFNREQMKKLKELDVIQHFNTVLNSEYKRGTFRETDEQVADIYEQASGKKVSRTFSCKSCVFNLYRDAGNLYRESEKYWKQEALKKAREAKENKKNNKEEENK